MLAVMLRSALGILLLGSLSSVAGCSGPASSAPAAAEPSPAEPSPAAEPPPEAAPPPRGKRAPCQSDQACNDDPSVSALWGRCTELGVCECKAGFERSPTTDLCRPVAR